MDLMAEMQDVSAMLMGYSLQKKSTARRSARILVQLRQAAAQNLLLKKNEKSSLENNELGKMCGGRTESVSDRKI